MKENNNTPGTTHKSRFLYFSAIELKGNYSSQWNCIEMKFSIKTLIQ